MDLVEMWLRPDRTRWIAGAAAGLLAGLVSMAFAMILSILTGHEAWFPVKVPAVLVLGGPATELGFKLGPILIGLVIYELVSMVLGAVYAKATSTNYFPALIGVGLVWAAFTWIFFSNLFVQSFMDILALQIPAGVTIFVALVFGLSLTSVAFFDRTLRGNRG